jgi:protein tyrosine/serine phosphatase
MRSLADILYNFHWIAPGEAARSAQAYAGFLGPFLEGRDIKSVVNLRGPNAKFGWWRYEKRICERLGVAHFDVMLNSRRLPTKQMLLNLLAAFDTAPAPLLLKCSGGQDRSSFAAALYIVHRKGWDAFDEALAQFAAWPYLHRPKRQQRWLKPFLTFARDTAKGAPLSIWLRDDYTPETLKAWLEARGLSDSFRGLYDKPGTAPGV